MPVPDFELFFLCQGLWEAYDTPFAWEYSKNSRRKYQISLHATAIIGENEPKADVAVRIIKTFNELIQENMPEGVSKVYIAPSKRQSSVDGVFIDTNKVKEFKRQIGTSLELWTYWVSYVDKPDYPIEQRATLRANIYFDKGTVGHVRLKQPELLRMLRIPYDKDNVSEGEGVAD